LNDLAVEGGRQQHTPICYVSPRRPQMRALAAACDWQLGINFYLADPLSNWRPFTSVDLAVYRETVVINGDPFDQIETDAPDHAAALREEVDAVHARPSSRWTRPTWSPGPRLATKMVSNK
jgi:hypothetical protein